MKDFILHEAVLASLLVTMTFLLRILAVVLAGLVAHEHILSVDLLGDTRAFIEALLSTLLMVVGVIMILLSLWDIQQGPGRISERFSNCAFALSIAAALLLLL